MGSLSDHIQASLYPGATVRDKELAFWAGAATSYGLPHKDSIVLLGDSITARGASDTATQNSNDTRGYWTWANVFLRQRFKVLNNAGVSGNKTSDVLLRLQTDVLNYSPGWCIVEIGINDVSNNIDAATIQTNLTTIYQTLIGAGIITVATTITPNNALTTAQQLVLDTVNQFIRKYAQASSGMILCDWVVCITDPTIARLAVNKWFDATYSTDGLHPITKGAARMGKYLASVLSNFPARSDFLVSNSGDGANLLANGLFNGSTAGVATSWTGSGTATFSKVARASTDADQGGALLQGEWQQLVTASAVNATINQASGAATVAPGDILYACCEFQTDAWTSVTAFGLQCQIRDNTGGPIVYTGFDLADGSADTWPLESQPLSGVLRTRDFTAPAASDRVKFFFTFTGQGTCRVSRAGVYKVV